MIARLKTGLLTMHGLAVMILVLTSTSVHTKNVMPESPKEARQIIQEHLFPSDTPEQTLFYQRISQFPSIKALAQQSDFVSFGSYTNNFVVGYLKDFPEYVIKGTIKPANRARNGFLMNGEAQNISRIIMGRKLQKYIDDHKLNHKIHLAERWLIPVNLQANTNPLDLALTDQNFFVISERVYNAIETHSSYPCFGQQTECLKRISLENWKTLIDMSLATGFDDPHFGNIVVSDDGEHLTFIDQENLYRYYFERYSHTWWGRLRLKHLRNWVHFKTTLPLYVGFVNINIKNIDGEMAEKFNYLNRAMLKHLGLYLMPYAALAAVATYGIGSHLLYRKKLNRTLDQCRDEMKMKYYQEHTAPAHKLVRQIVEKAFPRANLNDIGWFENKLGIVK